MSLKHDIVGLVERQFDGNLQAALSFTLADLSIDVDCTLSGALNGVRLWVLSDLRSEVDSLSVGTLKDALEQALSQADAAIDAIRNAGGGMSIDALYTELKVIEKALDKQFIDLVDGSLDLSGETRARLLVIAKPIEQRYDYVKYIANKVSRYARDPVQGELASVLQRTIIAIADGDALAYRHHLLEIIARAAEHRGTLIKEEEAYQIRYKADSLLRKIAERGVNKACGVDLSTTIAGIGFDGAFSWEMGDYRAPSKDVRTTGLEIGAGFDDEDWAISIDYEQEQRDYTDRLKDDSDRISHSIDLAFSWEGDPVERAPSDDGFLDDDSWTVTGSILLDSELYLNDIDDEIESNRVTQAIAAIQNLIAEVQGLGLPAAVEGSLLKELGEEGALGALIAGDRREAVDCLEDFIDEVYNAKWDGVVAPNTAQVLIDRVLSILPRKRIRQIKIPLSLDFPFRSGDTTLAVEWEEKLYPAHSLLNWNTVTTKVDYAKKEETFTLSGYVKHEALVYPNADVKDRSLTEWEGQAESALGSCDLALTVFRQETAYPNAASKNKCVGKGDLEIDFELFPVSITANLTEKLTQCPHDATKPLSQETEITLSASWEVGEGTFWVKLSDEVKRTYAVPPAEISNNETRRIEFSWAGEVTDDLNISLSSAWKDAVTWEDPVKNSRELTLQVEFDLSI